MAEFSLAGYPSLAAFLANDDRFLMCRRFKKLQARLILEKQDEMREVEEDLEAFDRADFNRVDGDLEASPDDIPYRLTTRRRRTKSEQLARQELIDRATTKFKEYAELICVAEKLCSLEKPRKSRRRSVFDFVWLTKPIRPSEASWMSQDQVGDIVALQGDKEASNIQTAVEAIVNRIKASRLFQARNPTKSMGQWLKDNRATERLATIVVSTTLTFLFMPLFIVPIYALSAVGDNIGSSIGLLAVFSMFFMLFIGLFTKARMHERLSAMAA